MEFEIHENYYLVTLPDGEKHVVRRDTYWDSGWKCQKQIDIINRIEKIIELEEFI